MLEQLRRIPNHGVGYGVLRYLHEDDKIANRLRDAMQSDILFNYLGRFSTATIVDHAIGPARQSLDSVRRLSGLRRYRLEFSGYVSDDQLSFGLVYSMNVHDRSTIERLAADLRERLLAFT